MELRSLNEGHFRQHGTRCRMRVPPEDKDPVLLHAPMRKPVARSGADNLRFAQFIRDMCSVFKTETFRRFLKRLLLHRRGPVERVAQEAVG